MLTKDDFDAFRPAWTKIQEMLVQIEAKRVAMPPEERAKLEAEELQAQRESFIRAMAPCEHGDPDWETCPHCLERIFPKEVNHATD